MKEEQLEFWLAEGSCSGDIGCRSTLQALLEGPWENRFVLIKRELDDEIAT
ncbi:unnamed protein product [Ixodes persulcatus]